MEKQQVPLESAIIEEANVNQYQDYSRQSQCSDKIEQGESAIILETEGPITYEYKDGVHHFKKDEFPDDQEAFIAQEKETMALNGGKIRARFSVKSKKNCEVYIRFTNLRYPGTERSQIKVNTDKYPKSIITRRESDSYSLHQTNHLMNLGYYKTDATIKGTIRFTLDGDYYWDDIEVYYVPMNHYVSRIHHLKKDALTDITMDDNTICGTIDSSKDQILVYSIPYSSGWKATIDGNPVKVQKINTMYLGFPVKAGHHDIVLEYQSPGILYGAFISICGVLLFLLVWISSPIIRRRRQRKAYSHFL